MDHFEPSEIPQIQIGGLALAPRLGLTISDAPAKVRLPVQQIQLDSVIEADSALCLDTSMFSPQSPSLGGVWNSMILVGSPAARSPAAAMCDSNSPFFPGFDLPPQLPLGLLPSQGSAAHAMGNCRPCAWFWKPKRCLNAQDCGYCHLCPKGELKIRKKAKLAGIRSGLTPKSTRSGGEDSSDSGSTAGAGEE